MGVAARSASPRTRYGLCFAFSGASGVKRQAEIRATFVLQKACATPTTAIVNETAGRKLLYPKVHSGRTGRRRRRRQRLKLGLAVGLAASILFGGTLYLLNRPGGAVHSNYAPGPAPTGQPSR
jgi:hypothetical protein